MRTLAQAVLESSLESNFPREGSRAAGNRATAAAVDVAWKNPQVSRFHDRIRACNGPEDREALAEEMCAALLPFIDAAAACGEIYMEISLPAIFTEKEDPSIEAFISALKARLEQDGYGLFRPGDKRVGLQRPVCTERVLISW